MSDDLQWPEGPDPPPPPPPEKRRPASWPARPSEDGSTGDVPLGDVSAETSDDAAPADAGEHGSRKWLRRTAVAAVFIVAVAGVVAGATTLLPDDGADTAADAPADAPTGEEGRRSPGEDGTELQAGEFDAFAHVLDSIDAAEREMIEFQIAAFQAEPDPEMDEPRPEEAIREDIAEAAESAVEDLGELRGELTGDLPDGEAVEAAAEARDAYVVHLDAWVAHLERVVEDPDLARADAPESEYDDINSTAEDFAEQLRSSLPEDAPEDLRDLASLILERGFSQEETGPGDVV